MLVSIVIPAYNEEAAIGPHLEAIVDYARGKPWSYEVLVVDDASADSTSDRVREWSSKHPEIKLLRRETNSGKGAAVRRGLAAAQGDIQGFTDADAATPITELDRVLEAMEAGAEFVIGSRAMNDTETTVVARPHRKIIGRIFNALLRMFVDLRDADGRALADTQCGFKWFTRDACESILARAQIEGFAFDVELLHLANRLGFKVKEMPVNWADRGESRVNLFVDPLKMLAQVMSVPWRHRGLKRAR